MKLSTRSRYGTRMLLDIALHCGDGPVRIRDISQRQGVSVKYLEKLIRPLKQAKMVRSKRGPKGGHILSRSPESISVGELVRLFEDDLVLMQCVKEKNICPISSDCLTRQVWIEAAEAMYERLNSVKLADLMKEARRVGGISKHCFSDGDS